MISFAQEDIGSVKRGYVLIAQLTVKKEDSSNVYKLRFLDASTETLKSIDFKYTETQLDELYIFLNNMLTEKNGTTKDLEIGNNKLTVTTQKMMGLRNVLITVNENYSFGLNGKELSKLFKK